MTNWNLCWFWGPANNLIFHQPKFSSALNTVIWQSQKLRSGAWASMAKGGKFPAVDIFVSWRTNLYEGYYIPRKDWAQYHQRFKSDFIFSWDQTTSCGDVQPTMGLPYISPQRISSCVFDYSKVPPFLQSPFPFESLDGHVLRLTNYI